MAAAAAELQNSQLISQRLMLILAPTEQRREEGKLPRYSRVLGTYPRSAVGSTLGRFAANRARLEALFIRGGGKNVEFEFENPSGPAAAESHPPSGEPPASCGRSVVYLLIPATRATST